MGGGNTAYPTAPMSLEVGMVYSRLTNISSCVKSYQGGRVKLYGETQTPKLIVKEVNEVNIRSLGLTSDLHRATFRITNLIIRNILHNGNSAKWMDRADALLTLILSLVLRLLYLSNGIPRKEEKYCARNLARRTSSRNFGITYGYLPKVSKNQDNLGPNIGGDGVAVLGRFV